ncbi:hypothetical protein [Actinoplanes flavus]|uniref:Uncharacterized protein n=1 Tax=Actinoplanes flavus TaxID=2820290 RepID=A0ABS3UND8_9ACTN|nr:hypothetical protein [Actinoplanes flavus]MBO3740284.1 hypothetical protein [Actinoplanes flavus]
MHLAAAIVASVDGPEDPAAVRQRYANELAALHAVAVRNLRYATSDMEFVYVLEALMAFENGGVWQRNLHWLASGEAEIDCPSCGEHLVLDLEGPDFLMASFTDPFLAPTTVAPVEHAEATMENRLLVLSQAHGRPAVAGKLPRLSGAQPAHAAERRSTYPKRSSETGITCKRKHSSSDGKPTRHLPRSVRRRNGCRGVAGDRRRIQLSCSDSGARAIQRSASKGNWSKTSPLPDPRRRSTRPITYRRHRREVGHDR